MQAADDAGVYIPRLCDVEGLEPQGSCRVCVVKQNGRTVSACTQPAIEGSKVENETEEILGYRRDLVRMLYHEGNHLCPICEASGRCELQAMGYRLGITQATKYPYLQPARPVDASHPDIVLDTNRCILCGRCIRASQGYRQKACVRIRRARYSQAGRRKRKQTGGYRCRTERPGHRSRNLPGGLHHPEGQGILCPDRRTPVRQEADHPGSRAGQR